MSQALLLGRDHVELGAIRVDCLGSRVALAISRGGVAKRYAHVDPNEDVVAAVELDDGRLVLVCADGHNGEPASRLAVQAVLARADTLDGPGALLEAFAAANGAVLAGQPHERCRTTLVVLVLDDRQAHWAAMGDSALVLLREGGPPQRLGDPRMHFVGFPMTAAELDDRLPRASVDRRDGDTWVLITDGLEEFLRHDEAVEQVIAEVAEQATDARDLSERLVRRAFEAGAGDNVATAVVTP